MSSDNRRKKKKTKRRDNDPVRVYDDGRIAYWTGGRPGLGKRVHERCGTREAATARAAELRVLLARVNGLGAHAAGTLDEAMQDMVHAMRAAGDPEGRIRQYRSNWNKWVPAKIGATRCLDVDIKQWSAIFDSANAAGASASTVRNVARTLGVVTEWTVDRGYFASSEPFGDPRRRKKIVKRARKRAQINRAEAKCRYLLDTCPTLAEIEKYAAAFEEVYPGYGQRLVLLAFATGLRINELLALRHDSIDLETGEVHVDWQLDRYQAWPARRLPKGGKTRIALLWACYEDVASSLIADSLAVGRDDVEPIQQSVEVAKELSHPDAQAEDLLAGLESIAARVRRSSRTASASASRGSTRGSRSPSSLPTPRSPSSTPCSTSPAAREPRAHSTDPALCTRRTRRTRWVADVLTRSPPLALRTPTTPTTPTTRSMRPLGTCTPSRARRRTFGPR